ncbi:MAG TPA: hypothetical protein DCS05_00335, partial [Nitrospiraceae bacterium]|nr:hypothetical protein [Nitrospiraceae bacterium]
AALTWIGQDTLLVTVLRREKREPDTWLYSFAVKPGTGEVRLLDDAEQEAIRKTIERNASEADSSALAEFGMFVIMLAIVVVSGGRATDSGESSGSSFEGVIENNGYDLTMKAKYGKRFWAFSRRQWRYSVKNNQTGRVFKGHYRPSEDAVEAFESWLKSWRISPDGRYYLIGKTASIIDSESRAAHTAFMSDYSNAGLDVSPSWDQVAILMMKPDERTGRLKCWIEFYPFTSGKQRTS